MALSPCLRTREADDDGARGGSVDGENANPPQDVHGANIDLKEAIKPAIEKKI
jgi:hypothetical protein